MATYLEELRRQKRRRWAWWGSGLGLFAAVYVAGTLQYFQAARKEALAKASPGRLLASARADPADAELAYTAAYKLWMAGKSDEALPLAERAVVLAPQRALNHLLVGYLYGAQDRPAEALRKYETASALDPGLHRAHASAGECYVKAGMGEDALRHLRLARSPSRPEAATQGALITALRLEREYVEAETMCREMMQYLPAHDVRGFVLLFEILQAQGRGRSVEKEMLAHWQKQPFVVRSDFFARLALILLDTDPTGQRIKEAETWARKAVTKRPPMVESHEALGAVRVRQERFEEAIQEFRKAEALGTLTGRSRRLMAQSLRKVGRSEEAGTFVIPEPRGGLAQATAGLRRNWEANPRDPQACLALASALEKGGDLARAFRTTWQLVKDGATDARLVALANRTLKAILSFPPEE